MSRVVAVFNDTIISGDAFPEENSKNFDEI